MTVLIDDIIKDELEIKLSKIKKIDGFNNDVSVINGFIQHYSQDMLDGKDGFKFPCLFYQPETDSVRNSSSGENSKIIRTMKLVGCVSTVNKKLIPENLNSLVNDVLNSLSMNEYDNKSKAMKVELGIITYSAAEDSNQYAYFETTVEITYSEQRRK